MAGFKVVSAAAFDAALDALRVRDEHELLESRFYDRRGALIAKVVRYLDDDGELRPEADLMLADPLPGQRPP